MKFIRRKGKTGIRQLKINVALGFQSIKNNITGKRQDKKNTLPKYVQIML